MKSWIKRWFDFVVGRIEPISSLTANEALQIARTHASSATEAERLQMALLAEEDGKKIWVVSEAAVGNVAFVEIDDATGELLRKGRHGIR